VAELEGKKGTKQGEEKRGGWEEGVKGV